MWITLWIVHIPVDNYMKQLFLSQLETISFVHESAVRYI